MQSLQANNIIKRKVAIVGSRNFNDKSPAGWVDIKNFIYNLSDDTIIVSGDGKGVDTAAARFAQHRYVKRGDTFHHIPLAVIEFTPDAELQAAKAKNEVISYGQSCARRNWKIADACDELVAFWTVEEVGGEIVGSPGTAMTIGFAYKLGKPVRVFNPQGEQLPEEFVKTAIRAIRRRTNQPMPPVVIEPAPTHTGMFDTADLPTPSKAQALSARAKALQSLRECAGKDKVGIAR